MSKQYKKIDVCIGNLDNGSEWVITRLKEEFPNVEGQRWGCLGNCGDCFRKPFVIANNRYLVDADNKEDLLEKIRTEMDPITK
ncbi:DUF1450 domain-containing protein [Tumebacillus sp. DT12]|uniref:DUF1450 domain-containing protein n=1 Tax=Tumebacillus lacus TaxID=2995335 RepID=A0ABT3X2K5_9BACL|nr:DUF1450 domain-containing protein [Tumebacillus lacus]MCX7571123.1 DUF1450 domain-containing protein [Tumebacillus lacus]